MGIGVIHAAEVEDTRGAGRRLGKSVGELGQHLAGADAYRHRQAELAEHVVTQLPAPIVQAALVGGPA